jgi:ATP-dependent Zn protease
MKNFLLWIVIIVILMAVFEKFDPTGSVDNTISYSEFIKKNKKW